MDKEKKPVETFVMRRSPVRIRLGAVFENLADAGFFAFMG